MFAQIFVSHPQSVGESYLEHQRSAWGFAGSLFTASVMCFLHGLIPALFETAGSRKVGQLHEQMMAKRRRIVTSTSTSAQTEEFCYSI